MPLGILMMSALALASYTDVKRMEIPVWLFPLTVTVSVIYMVYSGNAPGFGNWLGLVCMAIPLGILCFAGKLGGGDLIMFAAIGFLIGDGFIVYVLILGAAGMVFFLFTGCKEQSYPLAPFALVSYIIFFIWRCLDVYY